MKRASRRKTFAKRIGRTAAIWIACFGFVAIVYLFAVYFISFVSTKQIFTQLTDMKGKDTFPVFIIVGSVLWISCGFFAGYFVHRLRIQGTSKAMTNRNRSV